MIEGPDFCTLTWERDGQAPVQVWSRQKGDKVEWTDFPGGICGAAKQDDEIGVALAYDDWFMVFIQSNLRTGFSRTTVVETGGIYGKLRIGGRHFRVAAPDQAVFSNKEQGAVFTMQFGQDGKTRVNGEINHSWISASTNPAEVSTVFERYLDTSVTPASPPAHQVKPTPATRAAPALAQTEPHFWQERWLAVTVIAAVILGLFLFWKRRKQS